VNFKADDQPISNVKWMSRDGIKPNDYNPNHVAITEIELLKVSILEDGWTQPIVVRSANPAFNEDNSFLYIVDGFHRWKISDHKDMREMFNGQVPVVEVKFDPAHAIMSTVRHNRARGTHGILPMAEIVAYLLSSGQPFEEIMKRLGMEDEEVLRLQDRAGMPTKVTRTVSDFQKAWTPTKG